MKVRKLKTRIAAFGLAVLMGISTLSSVNAFAVEQTGSEQQTEVQAVTSQKDTSVTADDITKAVSDETFAVETCMEGIHYDAEKEDVTLVSIKDENGGEYHSDKAGTYIATYMVVPKDKSDSYTITRKVTLTDTEGQAHSEENGGEKQKSDTESEDDSDSPVQNYTDVEIETSEEDASAQAIKELKEDIEEGNVMVLSAAERATSSGSTVTLTKGRTIYYPSYIGNYLTCLFTVNGKIAYCLQSQKASPPSGSYVAQVLDSNKNLQKVLYYGYGGAGDLTGSYLSGKTEDLGLPDIDGVEIIKKIRTWSNMPIIVISARSEDTDKIDALDAGADDYLTKPFSVEELLARLRVTQRRLSMMQKVSPAEAVVFVNGKLRVDYAAGCAYLNEEELHLTPIEYKLLCLLTRNIGKVLTHTFLTQSIWGSSWNNDIASLRVFMATLRKKIEKEPNSPQYIQTHIGVGYRMLKVD